MDKTWWVVIGILAAGAVVLLLLPLLVPGGESAPAVADIESAPAIVAPGVEVDSRPDVEDEEPAAQTDPAPETATVEDEPRLPMTYSIDGTITVDEYRHSAEIAGVEVHWANDATYLRIGLVAPGTGYVSIGFGSSPRMEGANMILGYVSDGKSFFRDDYGIEARSHMADVDRGGTDNIIASSGAEWTDQTILEFIIPLDSGDAMDLAMKPGDRYAMMVAYHDLQDGYTVRHSRRGAGEIDLDPVP